MFIYITFLWYNLVINNKERSVWKWKIIICISAKLILWLMASTALTEQANQKAAKDNMKND